MSTIWLLIIGASVLFAVANGRMDEFTRAMFEAGKASVEVCLYLVGIM